MANRSTETQALWADQDWTRWALPAQRAPEGDWRIWLFMGGRGAGKTRAGAEWVRGLVETGAARRIALVGPTLGDVREVMIAGPSGLCSIGMPRARPAYEVSRRRLVWRCGAEAFAFSAEDPDSLRGPQFDAAWCDEIGAWAHGEATWDNLMFTLRLGDDPRVAATTTPRATALVKRLVRMAASGRAAITWAATRSNADNLAPGFVEAVTDAYAGTRLARQELDGELVEDPPGAIFSREAIERGRMRLDAAAELAFDRVVVAVDPPAMAGPRSDACGIVAAGRAGETVYVLSDASAQGLKPLAWAERAVALAKAWGAGEIAAEANQGGEMVRKMLELAGATPEAGLRVRLTRATQSKTDRAMPVSVLYERGRVRHAGIFRELEDEMCALGGEGDRPGGRRADRVDALVRAVIALLEKPCAPPGVLSLWDRARDHR
ncbi:MAG: ATP-binding protein [Alphaproteobacteria bacterium]|nr:ATP-binding protein [Alphaproteobacteria bacterium]